ncbi:MAG: DUF5706 domain-containing protein [Actinomycetota bacterium]|nr:DUF5706 domain-containing protein [Actinomycetota bacterium]
MHAATQDWIRGIDTKASLTLAVIAAVGLFAAGQVFSEQGSLYDPQDEQLWAVRAMALAFTLSGLSALHAVFPSLKRKRARKLAKSGLIYFGHLRHRSTDEIYAALANVDDDVVLRQLASQLEATSAIAWKKHARLQRAHALLVLGLVAFGIAELM